MCARRAESLARASAARAAWVRRRRIAMPATTSSWAVLDAGRKKRGVELGERMLGLVQAADPQETPDLEVTRIARRSCDRRAPPALRVPRPAPSPASPGRERRAQSQPRRQRLSRGPRTLSGRRLARLGAGEPLLERDRRAGPSRCLEARAQARRRAGQPASCAQRITRGARARRGVDQRVSLF